MSQEQDQPQKIVENKIVEKIKSYVKHGSIDGRYIMLNNGKIVEINKYAKIIKKSQTSAYVYVNIISAKYVEEFLYPFLYYFDTILNAYISKRGLYYYHYDDNAEDLVYYSVPAQSLKFVSIYVKYSGYSLIEIVDLDNVVNNTNLVAIIDNVLNTTNECLRFRYFYNSVTLSDRGYQEIYDKYRLNPIFDGRGFSEAMTILSQYCEKNTPLTDLVAKIIEAYYRIFRPYKFCFDSETWRLIDCPMPTVSNKP